MVGSGFSRNALPIRPHAADPPMWREVARQIANRLYPQGGKGNQPREMAETSATDGLLRLGQEYATTFGRGDLHRFLRQLIRDDDLKPGEAHTRLLRLPWRNVFTTNWDTLLERARASAAHRAYSVVRTMDEIPLANRPRIVKLHGSFPAHFPLIVTEEDYRTYPTQFAPFVNTVQQAMMETVFCLIGFSGNDPNFLNWSGWIRDNLGTAAPKIYLAGWLALSPSRRCMLEAHNVLPIDLALHPKAGEWPEHLRHDYATEWILHTLERARPYDVTDWPSPRSQQYSSIPAHLQPVHKLVSEGPKKEPLERPDIDSEDLPENVRQTLDIWSHNRKIYPNWLAVPASARQLMSLPTNEWEPGILRALPHFAPVDRLNAIRELVWRREILLDPISSELESAVESVLQQIDCQARTIEGVPPTQKIAWDDLRKAWVTVGLALVTAARHRFDEAVFKSRIEALSIFQNDGPEIAQRIHHEYCLSAIYSMNFRKLPSLLKNWSPENCDPIWTVRKAAILYEINRTDEAVELCERALLAIQRIPDDGRSLAGLSREGWALWLKWALEWSQWTTSGEREDLPKDGSFRRRWRALASFKCDALSERDEYISAMKATAKEAHAPSFDLEVRTRPGLVISNEKYDRWVSTRRAVRLCEVAGLPNSASGVLKPAIDELSGSEPELAIRLILRTLSYDADPVLKRALSRSRVAAMSADLAKRLSDICNNVIDYALPRIVPVRANRPLFWIERLRVAMEVLSRLVLRLEPDRVETVFDKTLELYRNHQIAQEPWLTSPVRNALKRSWEALAQERRTARILDLLGAPIVGMDNFRTNFGNYPDPGDFLQDNLSPPVRTDENEGRWQKIISLLVRALHAGGEARKRAATRVVAVDLPKRLNEAEAAKIARALWSEKHTGPNDLPGQTVLFDWVFLLLPEPEPGLAEKRFRNKWLATKSAPQEKGPSLDDILWQVGKAIAGLKVRERSLALSEEERSYLIEVVKQWSVILVPPLHPFGESQLRKATRQALYGLRTIISEIKIPEDTASKLYKKVQKLNDSGIPAFGLITGLVKAMPNHFDELALFMRMGLVSDNVDLAEGAAAGLYHWLTMSAGGVSQIQPPPDDLVREVGIMIAARSKGRLSQALQIAKWVFDEGSDAQKEAIRQLALQGLGYLVEELRYDREHDRDDNNDVPLLRWRSAQLALSMATHGSEDDPAVCRWLEIAEEDPLPEVRYVTSPAFVRQPENEESADD